MPKPSQKNKREKQVKRPIIEVDLVPRKSRMFIEQGDVRDAKELPLKKRFLIVCEGPTEAGYFEGLCDLFDIRDSYTIEILPQQTDDNKEVKYKGSSIKGLLYMAMKKQKMATIPFDEVWIVPDNDEENAFKLEENSFQRIKESVPEHLYENLKAHQLKEMDVREVEQQNNEHCRVRYFLSLVDYENFLKEHIPNPADLQFVETIISLTTKKRDFLYLYSDSAKVFFYDKEGAFISKNYRGRDAFEERFFDKNWRKYIKTAYSCISFEHWILLHFEKNNHSF